MFTVHIFPSCEFANENLNRIAPDLMHRVADIAHLLIVIATVWGMLHIYTSYLIYKLIFMHTTCLWTSRPNDLMDTLWIWHVILKSILWLQYYVDKDDIIDVVDSILRKHCKYGQVVKFLSSFLS